MGSRSKILDHAYIAGFLDGDGSLMLQIKKRRDGRIGWRFMFTICFYQDNRHEKTLFWIRKKLKIGYISRRNDGITELRINGYKQIKNILQKLLPFIRFKKVQAEALLKASELLTKKSHEKLNNKERLRLAEYMFRVQTQNYVTKRKKRREEILRILDLTP